MAADSNLNAELAGSGFLIGVTDGCGLVLTARHVLDYALSIQRPRARPVGSALKEFLPPSARTPALDPLRFSAIWLDGERAHALSVHHVCLNESSDLAFCLVAQGPDQKRSIGPGTVGLRTTPPSIGDIVHTVAFDRMRADPVSLDGQPSRRGVKLHMAVSIRRGLITGVFLNGLRHYRWPCVTTTIPFEPGMSGGFAYEPVDGCPVHAYGVVAADNSVADARLSQHVAGESIVALAYMALALKVPTEARDGAPENTLQEAMRQGAMPPPMGGFEQFRFAFS